MTAGHHDPASMTPFPTMHELFSIGWGEPDLREQWKKRVATGPRAAACSRRIPVPTNLIRTARTLRHLPTVPSGTAAPPTSAGCTPPCRPRRSAARRPSSRSLSTVPGIDLDKAKWPYIGAKAGNLPGDLTFSWYAVDHTGQPWVVSFQLNWPHFYSATAASWLLSIAHEAFDLAPVA